MKTKKSVLFTVGLDWVFKLTGIVPFKVFLKFVDIAEEPINRVALTAGTKKRIIDDLKISEVAFYKAINTLVEQKVMKPFIYKHSGGEYEVMKGEYLINSEVFSPDYKVSNL